MGSVSCFDYHAGYYICEVCLAIKEKRSHMGENILIGENYNKDRSILKWKDF